MQGQLIAMRSKFLFLVSVSLAALTGAHAQAQSGGGFLIDAPIAAPARAPAAPAAALPKTNALEAPQAAPDRQRQRITIKPIDAEEGGADETALRYYATQNDMKRVAAEIDRLRRLYPGWRPPETLVEPASTSTEDEQPLWDLFAVDRLEELRAAIAQRQQVEPEWRPSKDLTDKIARKEMRLRLMAYWNAGQLTELIDSVAKDGYGGDRADVDLQWIVAEAYGRMHRTDEALAIYRSLLNTLVDTNERKTTIQKAMATLRIADLEPLFEKMMSDATGRAELMGLANEITRARIAAFLRDERAERIPDAEFKAYQEHVRTSKDPNEIGLVAWYYLKIKSTRDALEWFKLALEQGGDAMIAHGLANSLRELGLKREAEEVAFAWRDPLINNAILFIDVLETELTKATPPYIEPERLARYAQVTMDLASGEGAQALGWYAYNTCQFEAAHEWFERAVAWYPKEATVYGLVLASRRTKRTKEVFELANRYDGLFPKVISVLFPDGYQRPPSPCDMLAAGSRAPSGFRPAQSMAPSAQRHAFGGPAPGFPGQQQAWQQPWQAPALTPVENDRMPKFARGEFPAAVDPENNRRFASSGRITERPMQISTPPAAQTPLRAEQRRNAPLVARRVQGVGPMPYERWGFSLLPGANGQTTPDSPHSAQVAPVGTTWASEPTGSRPVESFADPYLSMQAITKAPRVPAPAAARMAPRGPVAPNFMRGAELRPGLDVDMTATGSIEGGDQPAGGAPSPGAPDGHLPPGLAYPVPVPHSPVRKEESEADVDGWLPRLERMLAQLGDWSPQSLGCPIMTAVGVQGFCDVRPSEKPSTKVPEQE